MLLEGCIVGGEGLLEKSFFCGGVYIDVFWNYRLYDEYHEDNRSVNSRIIYE